MKNSVQVIPLVRLALVFVPVAVVIAVLLRWTSEARTALYAVSRMLAQLLLVGYVLAFIFESQRGAVVLSVLAVMLAAAAWISLRPVKERQRFLAKALAAIALGGATTLALVTQGVLGVTPWFEPRFLIPLGGMIFANSMNSVSLAAERVQAEVNNQVPYPTARARALRAALIPITNSLFAVGLVSLPGLMTGQILAGVSPLVAARYQIVVMGMIYGAAGIAAACFLALLEPEQLRAQAAAGGDKD